MAPDPAIDNNPTPPKAGLLRKDDIFMSLSEYLSEAIDNIFKEAMRASLENGRESLFLMKAAASQKAAARRRLGAEKAGAPVPPFLIASIATRCNLHCAGCYARANHACADSAAQNELSAARWGELFDEAKELGVSFILLAGGEPLERPDVIERAAAESGMIFPVFTNGTMLEGKMLDRFDRSRNLVPVISIEGGQAQTDARRGRGTFGLVARAMCGMKARGIFYGASVTVTKDNVAEVTDEAFSAKMRENGCQLLFFVEYVPADGDARPAPGEEERRLLAERLETLRRKYPDMIFLSFPGDEKALGGCLAAGRGFFHINAFGGAEPCPFSPYSDVSLREGSLRDALASPLFRKIRGSGLEAEEHVGGCALFASRERVAAMLSTPAGDV